MRAAVAREHAGAHGAVGPGGGVIGAAHIARAAGFDNVITVDMGGTSFDVCIIVDGAPGRSSDETRLGYRLPLRVPMIDIHTIGAGGGSIARGRTPAACCRSGPQSAGAVPGPVCYGRGGTEPTVTDANLVLGRCRPSARWRRGRPSTSAACARRSRSAIGERARSSMRSRPPRSVCAWSTTAWRARSGCVTLERGHDPRDFALFAFGGAGPLHARGARARARHPDGDRAAACPASRRRSGASWPTCATTSCAPSSGRSKTLDVERSARRADRAAQRRRRVAAHASSVPVDRVDDRSTRPTSSTRARHPRCAWCSSPTTSMSPRCEQRLRRAYLRRASASTWRKIPRQAHQSPHGRHRHPAATRPSA